MNRLARNELIGTVAMQSALENTTGCRMSLAKAMLVLPMVFDKTIRSVLKRKNSVVLSSKDLLISNPSSFVNVRARYEDLTITSLNAILLAHELGILTLNGDCLVLKNRIFTMDSIEIGNVALDILAAGPKLGLVLNEAALDLYQTFRIEL